MLRTFIQVAALVLTLESAIFLTKGNLGLSAKLIAQLASTKWNYNFDVARSLSTQRADTWIGVILLLAAFGLQMWNSLWPMRIGDFAVDKTGVLVALVVCAIVFVGCLLLSNRIASVTEEAVKGILNPPTAKEVQK